MEKTDQEEEGSEEEKTGGVECRRYAVIVETITYFIEI